MSFQQKLYRSNNNLPEPDENYNIPLTIEDNKLKSGKKFKIVFFFTILYYTLTNPYTHRLFQNIFFNIFDMTNEYGILTPRGLLTYTTIFFICGIILLNNININ